MLILWPFAKLNQFREKLWRHNFANLSCSVSVILYCLTYKGGRLHQWGSARAKAWRGLEHNIHNMIWQYLTELFGEENILTSFLESSRLFCVFRRWLNVHTAFTMVGHLSLFHYVYSWCASHRPQMAFIIRTAGFLLWFVQSLGAAMAMAFPTVAPCPFASQQFWCALARWQWRLARSVLLGSEKSLKSQEDSNWGRCFICIATSNRWNSNHIMEIVVQNCCAYLLCDCCGLQGLSWALAGRHLMRPAHRFARQKTEGLPVLWACAQSWFLLCSTRVCLWWHVPKIWSWVNFLTPHTRKRCRQWEYQISICGTEALICWMSQWNWKSGCSARAHIF